MPELLPFRSFYYREGKDIKKLSKLVAPPYDVIGDEEQIELRKNKDNIIHIILPETYEKAQEKLEEMINKKALITEEDKCLYIYGIDYINPETEERLSRYGIVGLLKLVEIFPARDNVIPHEMTFRKYTEDRLKLIHKTDSNFSPIFMIYDGGGEAHKIFDKYIEKKPFLQAIDRDNFTHKIWEISDQKDINSLQKLIKENQVIIADGHHRYITCLRHSRHGGCNYIMALFIDFNDPGLIIYTTHREVRMLPIRNIEEFKEKVSDYFIVEVLDYFKTLQDIMDYNKNKHVFGVYFRQKYLFLRLKESIRPEDMISGIHSNEWKNLNIPILHEILLENSLNVKSEDINFIKDVKKGIDKVDEGKIDALFLLNPTTLSEIETITRLKEIMPQKSTYFYPKPLSGLVIHRHSNEIE
ncbi:MAG: DUF1015 domain-containing protein [Promethearchaeota archaeon]|nr:MAG: DUF1015 domain-containing protein [Candidatus Lokiarchaeota archaeon]